MKEILMSIHNEWADLIFSHKKTVELRKNIPVIRNLMFHTTKKNLY